MISEVLVHHHMAICIGPVAAQNIMAGACDGGLFTSRQPGSKRNGGEGE
jgi:hypothetical protein